MSYLKSDQTEALAVPKTTQIYIHFFSPISWCYKMFIILLITNKTIFFIYFFTCSLSIYNPLEY